jgi:hypothetical protein
MHAEAELTLGLAQRVVEITHLPLLLVGPADA